MTKKLVLVAALSLVAAQPAAAETFVAYGTGLTRCTIDVYKERRFAGPPLLTPVYSFGGRTSCDAALEQTGQAFLTSGMYSGVDGGLCSGFRAVCASGQEDIQPGVMNGPTEYRVALRAPNGQGWLGAPTHCTGIGTDNLRCVFTANDALSAVAHAYEQT